MVKLEKPEDCPDHQCIAFTEEYCYSFSKCHIKKKIQLKHDIDEIIRRWLPGQIYGYNEAVDEIMERIKRTQ